MEAVDVVLVVLEGSINLQDVIELVFVDIVDIVVG